MPKKQKVDPIGIPNVNFTVTVPGAPKKFLAKWRSQRLKRGFDDTELYNLDTTVARFLAPRLRALRESTCSYPSGITMRTWKSYLKKMETAFELYADKFNWSARKEKGNIRKVDEGLSLFHAYFYDLWW